MKKKKQEGLFTMTAKTMFGLEHILAEELKKLGAQNVKSAHRLVYFDGDMGFLYKANLCLRTALKVMLPIKSFKIEDAQDLYDETFSINWPKHFEIFQSFKIDAVINSDLFQHSNFPALKVKDAIVDRFRKHYDKRPNIDTDEPDVVINLHINRNSCTISMDSSGESLHKRGYKTAQTLAPINEVLAASMIMMTGWKDDAAFVDPMCGSGTFLTEAAMIAANIPVNIHRKKFLFQNWIGYDDALFNIIKEGTLKRTKVPRCKIIGYDINPFAVSVAKENCESAMVEDYVEIKEMDFFKTFKPFGPTMLLFNPPYNERLVIMEADFYREVGDTLKKNYSNAIAWMISSNFNGLKSVGLRTSTKIALKNGPLDCKLVRYDLYDGSTKKKFKKD